MVFSLSENRKVLNCKRCMLFRSHDAYEYLGLCIHKNELIVLTPGMKTCENFKEATLNELKKTLMKRGWLHCASCNKVIYTVEELEQHIDCILVSELYSDIVASEEAPAAD